MSALTKHIRRHWPPQQNQEANVCRDNVLNLSSIIHPVRDHRLLFAEVQINNVKNSIVATFSLTSQVRSNFFTIVLRENK
jgi:hypothetical protein